MASITSSVKGFQDFTELCKGTCKGYAYNLVRLYDECDHACCEKAKKSKNRIQLSFKDAESRLKQHIEETLSAIDLERQVKDYCIGRSYVMSRKGVSFDPMNHYTWTLEGGLNAAWKNIYVKKEYDGLVALACIERDMIHKDLRSKHDAVDQEFYSTALTQALIHNFVIKHPDRRCKNNNCDAGPKWKNKYKAGVVYIAFKCEQEQQWYEEEEEVEDETKPSKLQNDSSFGTDNEVLMEQIMKLENELADIRSQTDDTSSGSSTSNQVSSAATAVVKQEITDEETPLMHSSALLKVVLNQKRVKPVKNNPDDQWTLQFEALPRQTANDNSLQMRKIRSVSDEVTAGISNTPRQTANDNSLQRRTIRSVSDEVTAGISNTLSSKPNLQTKELSTADDNDGRGGKQQKTGKKHKLTGETSTTFPKRPKTTKASQSKDPAELTSQTVVTGKAEGIMTTNLAELQTLVRSSIATVKQRRAEDDSDNQHVMSDEKLTKKKQKQTTNKSRTVPAKGNIQSNISGSEASDANSQTPAQSLSQSANQPFTKNEVDMVSKSIRTLFAKGLHACTIANLKEDMTKRLHVLPHDQQYLFKKRIENGAYGLVLKDVLKRIQKAE